MKTTPRRIHSGDEHSGHYGKGSKTPRRGVTTVEDVSGRLGGNFGGSNDGTHPFSFHVADVQFDDRKLQFEKQIVQAAQDAIRRTPPRSGVTLSAIRRGYIPSPVQSIFGSITRCKKPTIITNNIVIGAREDAGDHKVLKDLGITHIINLTSVVPCHFPESFIYLHLPIQDQENVNITLELPAVAAFIKHVEKVQGRVLVHCIVGVSRSVTLVIMYMMTVHNIRLKHLYDAVEALRPIINPNEGFKLQMAKLEVREFGGSSITHVSRYKGAGCNQAWDFYGWNNIKSQFPVWNDQDSQPVGANTQFKQPLMPQSSQSSYQSNAGDGNSIEVIVSRTPNHREGRRRNSHTGVQQKFGGDTDSNNSGGSTSKDGRRRHSHGLILPPVSGEQPQSNSPFDSRESNCRTRRGLHGSNAVVPGVAVNNDPTVTHLDSSCLSHNDVTSRDRDRDRIMDEHSGASRRSSSRGVQFSDCCICS